jgi:hypothetical protein
MQPRWRADGRELFFVSAGRKLLFVSIDTRGGFKAAPAIPLFDINVPSVAPSYANDYSVSADGMRFLVNRRLAGMSVGPSASSTRAAIRSRAGPSVSRPGRARE